MGELADQKRSEGRGSLQSSIVIELISVSAPPGEEDEESSGACNGYAKSEQERGKERNGYGSGSPWLKSRHGSAGSSGSNGQSSATSGYGSGGSRIGHHESGRHPGQQGGKIPFNEDEYTRITAPRLDVLFKKSYLQNKAWANVSGMSATPSTTGSQSASHSTAGRGIAGGQIPSRPSRPSPLPQPPTATSSRLALKRRPHK
jgi:hypothetical protein